MEKASELENFLHCVFKDKENVLHESDVEEIKNILSGMQEGRKLLENILSKM